MGSWRAHRCRNRRLSRGRAWRRGRRSRILPVVLSSILGSVLPPVLLLSAVLSYNDSIHVPAISDAVVPSARFRILVDPALVIVPSEPTPLGHAMANR
jgi:hypothetical protein